MASLDQTAALATTGVVALDRTRDRALAEVGRRDGLAKILAGRRLELLPLDGPGAPFTGVQGRGPDDSTTPLELADLISSIELMGVLQPIMVEERPAAQPGELPVRLLVAGERRLRSVRWLHANRPDGPHARLIPAIVVTGPLADEDRRAWQLIENVAREDLQPGELAAALMFERCALLTVRLLTSRIAVPREILNLDSPVERFEALEKLRAGAPAAAAPWEDVIGRLGLQMSPRKARKVVMAFRAMPSHISQEMDEERVTLATRVTYVELRRDREQAADDIWAAVTAMGKPALLTAAVGVAKADPNCPPAEAVRRAEEFHAEANASRSDKLSRQESDAAGAGGVYLGALPAQTGGSPETTSTAVGMEPETFEPVVLTRPVAQPARPPAGPAAVRLALDGLRGLLEELDGGAALARYDAGSLKLLLRKVAQHLADVNAEAA